MIDIDLIAFYIAHTYLRFPIVILAYWVTIVGFSVLFFGEKPNHYERRRV